MITSMPGSQQFIIHNNVYGVDKYKIQFPRVLSALFLVHLNGEAAGSRLS